MISSPITTWITAMLKVFTQSRR